MAALDPLATVDDLEDLLGETISDDQQARAAKLLWLSSIMVRSYVGLDWADGDVPDAASAVSLTVAARAWYNPAGATQVSETLGTFNHSESFGPHPENLFLSGQEKAMLDRLKPRASALWVQPTTRDQEEADECLTVPYTGVGGYDGQYIPMFNMAEPY